MGLHIVLLQPEIPQNTGNIARTCAATGATLHLVRPLGYSLSDKYLKRAGLDYWHLVTIKEYPDNQAFFSEHPREQCYFFTKKARTCYADIAYPEETYFVFGRESVGLDEDLLLQVKDRAVRIPMRSGARCLNLSNSVAIAAYEYFRQRHWQGLVEADDTFDWEEGK
ncbi:MAG: tRNA (cytidine(34)-2'-O)-methyltransferase [Sphaerochaetaceae bacterium]|nr:tRNA (cytidine(34)-2'-O)-methyltransferase [Spirochaetales bacterium]MDY5498756.1 tRNA (cytidine(34)-2'-O)-methyltransferase [Sphaerochaetaceae bacterium]